MHVPIRHRPVDAFVEHQHIDACDNDESEFPRRSPGSGNHGRLGTEQCDARGRDDDQTDVGDGQQTARGRGDRHDAVPGSQQSKVESESWADKERDPKDVNGLQHGVEVLGIAYRLAECGALQHHQPRAEKFLHTQQLSSD